MDTTGLEEIWEMMYEHTFEVDPESKNDNLLCLICKKLMTDACHSVCGCHYCYRCISSYLKEGDKCCLGNQEKCSEEFLVLERDVMRDIRMNKKIRNLRVLCPNEACKCSVRLYEMKEHMRLCTMKLIQCPYTPIGCENEEKIKKTILIHLNDEVLNHTQLLIDWIQNLRNEINGLKDKIELGNKEINCLKEEATKNDARLSELIVGITSENQKLIDQMANQRIEIIEELAKQKSEIMEEITKINVERVEEMTKGKNEIMEEITKEKSQRSDEITKQKCEILEKMTKEKEEIGEKLAEQRKDVIEELIRQKKDFDELIVTQNQTTKKEVMDEIRDFVERFESKQREMSYMSYDDTIEDLQKKVDEINKDLIESGEWDSFKSSLDFSIKSTDTVNQVGKSEIDLVQIQLSEFKEVMQMKTERFEHAIDRTINNWIKLCPIIDADFIWRIEDCSTKMRTRRGRRIFSESFYSNNYKLCLYVFINNTGCDARIYCLIMPGDHDDRIKWPMTHAVTVSIIDQNTLRVHESVTSQYQTYLHNRGVFDRPTEDMNRQGICTCPILDYTYVRDHPSLMVNDSMVVSCVISD